MFKREVREKREQVEVQETFTAEIDGYDVIVTRTESHGLELSIYRGGDDRIRLGLLKWYPKSVAALEQFAIDGPKVLAAIAAGLREAGMDDLRSGQERRMEEILEQSKAAYAEMAKEGR